MATAIEAADEDVRTIVFLNDAPSPRRFWARRQCHETTMHAVDALSASLGRRPVATDSWIDPVLARDGIDELLGGFLTRNHSRLRCEEPTTVLVVPTDADESWRLDVSMRPAMTTRRTSAAVDGDDDADVVLRAPVGRALPRALEPLRRGDRGARPRRPVAQPVLHHLGIGPAGAMRSGVGAGR